MKAMNHDDHPGERKEPLESHPKAAIHQPGNTLRP